MKPEFVETIDCRNMSCPLPILKTKKGVDKIEIGQVLEMVATDPGSEADINAWVRQTEHELVFSEKVDKDFFYYIKRTH